MTKKIKIAQNKRENVKNIAQLIFTLFLNF